MSDDPIAAAINAAVFPEFVAPPDRCDFCRRNRKAHRIEVIARQVAIDKIAFYEFEACNECYAEEILAKLPEAARRQVIA